MQTIAIYISQSYPGMYCISAAGGTRRTTEESYVKALRRAIFPSSIYNITRIEGGDTWTVEARNSLREFSHWPGYRISISVRAKTPANALRKGMRLIAEYLHV